MNHPSNPSLYTYYEYPFYVVYLEGNYYPLGYFDTWMEAEEFMDLYNAFLLGEGERPTGIDDEC